MTNPTPSALIKAHQYLYYITNQPIWSDYKYDMFCKKHGINGHGGSDRVSDYDKGTTDLATEMLRHPKKYRVI